MDTHFHLTGRKSTCVACRHKDRRDANARQHRLNVAREARLRESMTVRQTPAERPVVGRGVFRRSNWNLRTVVFWTVATPLSLLFGMMILSLLLSLLMGGSGPLAAVLAWGALVGSSIGVVVLLRQRRIGSQHTAISPRPSGDQ
jgi:hypothetical protein